MGESWHNAAWMQTYTGKAFRPWQAEPEDIDVRDVARSLAMTCRYNGHVQQYYSVAQHCVLMADWILAETGDRNLARWCLAHDAAEAYIGDMVRPLKVTAGMEAYRILDDRLTAAIAVAWDLPEMRIPDAVKEADTRILLDERNVLLGRPAEPWGQDTDGTVPLGVEITGWSWQFAEDRYLARAATLGVEF